MRVTADNYSSVNLDALPINEDWDGRDVSENLMHRIHAYPAKFPAFITTKAIQYAESKAVHVDTVADIFCGCGTVAYETVKANRHFWGCDINPVATLIARTKSRHYDNERLNTVICNLKENKAIIERSRKCLSVSVKCKKHGRKKKK